MDKTKLSYAVGTQVHVVERDLSIFSPDDTLLVSDVSVSTGNLQYAINGCAWFDHSCLEFVADPTEESLRLALQFDIDEDSGDEEY